MNFYNDASPNDGDKTQRAYNAGANIARSRMSTEDPLAAEALTGCYDHVERVLGALDVPYKAVGSGLLRQVRLRPDQMVVVNCPGNLTGPEIVQIRDFVAAGGTLFTTDWALRNVIEPAFPGYIEYNDIATTDD